MKNINRQLLLIGFVLGIGCVTALCEGAGPRPTSPEVIVSLGGAVAISVPAMGGGR